MQITEQTGPWLLSLASNELIRQDPLLLNLATRLDTVGKAQEFMNRWNFNHLPQRAARAAELGMQHILKEALLNLEIRLLGLTLYSTGPITTTWLVD